jgi:hypothetical protein
MLWEERRHCKVADLRLYGRVLFYEQSNVNFKQSELRRMPYSVSVPSPCASVAS